MRSVRAAGRRARAAALAALLALAASWGAPAGAQEPARPAAPQEPAPREAAPQEPAEGEEQDGGQVRLSSEVVLVPVAARHEKGGLVRDLKAADVRVAEDGREQEVAFFSLDTAPLDVVLLVDGSGSVAASLDTVRSAALSFVKQLRPEDRVTLLSFSDRPVILEDWTGDFEAVSSAVRSIKPAGATALYGSVVAAVYERFGERPAGRRRAVVVLTDGDDTISTVTSRSAARAAVRFEASVYVVSVNRVVRDAVEQLANNSSVPPQQRAGHRAAAAQLRRAAERLETMADETGGRVLELRRYGDLKRAYAEVAEEIRSRYLVGYYPSSEPTAGFHEIEVTTRRPGVVVRARQGYYRE